MRHDEGRILAVQRELHNADMPTAVLRADGHAECPEVAPACSPNAYQRRPDWHVNAIGSDKPPYRKLATRKSLGGCMSVPAIIVFFPSQFVPFIRAGCVSADRPTCFFLS